MIIETSAITGPQLPPLHFTPAGEKAATKKEKFTIVDIVTLSYALTKLGDAYQKVWHRFLLSGTLGEKYQHDRDSKLKKEALTASVLFEQLFSWANKTDATVTHPLLKAVFAEANLTPEATIKLRQTIATELDGLYTVLEAMHGQLENTDGKTEAFKLEQATLNQKLAEYFYLAALNDRFSSEYQSAATLASLCMALTKGDNFSIPGAREILFTVAGARAQAGLCEAFKSAGYTVILPNYNNPQEIIDWDLKGIDFIVVSPDGKTMCGIDAKARSTISLSESRERESKVAQIPGTPRSNVTRDIFEPQIVNRQLELIYQPVNASHQKAMRQAVEHLKQQGELPADANPEFRRYLIKLPPTLEFMDSLGVLHSDVKNQLIKRFHQKTTT